MQLSAKLKPRDQRQVVHLQILAFWANTARGCRERSSWDANACVLPSSAPVSNIEVANSADIDVFLSCVISEP